MEKNAPTQEQKPQQEQAAQPQQPNPNACRYCGFITPFDPYTPGYCCPSCGGVTYSR